MAVRGKMIIEEERGSSYGEEDDPKVRALT